MTADKQTGPPAQQVPEADGAAAPSAEDRAVQQVEQDIEALLDESRREASEYLQLAQRTQADFENYRKRVSAQAAEAQVRGKAKIATELLPVLDNLERAIEAIGQGADLSLAEGVKLVHADLVGVLGRAGVESYEPLGERFDPNLHEAVMTKPDSASAPDTVVEVMEKGYRLGEDVLRPARVVVAAGNGNS